MKTHAWCIALGRPGTARTLESRLAPAIAIGVVIALASCALADDAALEFGGSNPTLNWSYGWSVSPGSAFNPFTQFGTTIDGLDAWTAPNKSSIGHNCVMGYPWHQYGATLPPRSLSLRPGSGGQSAVLRWTAPATRTYHIEAAFKGSVDTRTPPPTGSVQEASRTPSSATRSRERAT